MNMLSLEGVSAMYGTRRVLSPLFIAVRPGERIALVGKSGAGKSTLLSLMFDQSDADTAFIPQELGLVQQLSVFHNVFMGRLDEHATWYNLVNLVRPLPREMAAMQPLLETLCLTDKLHAPVGELSGGQKQRVAVARALFQRASLLLADEPVSALDGPLSHVVMKTLTSAYKTAVIALHDVDLALRYTDRVVGIRDGGIVLDESTERLSSSDLSSLY